MSQKLPVNRFELVEELPQFKEDFIKNYDENSDIGYFLEVDVEYLKILLNLYNDLPFLPERKKIEKCNKLISEFRDNKKYVVHINTLKQALNHGSILKKLHRVIQFNQNPCLKSYIDMNTKSKKEAKYEFEKDFLS